MELFGNNMAKEVVTQGSEYNTLAFGTKIIGEIHAENNFRIDGTVEGSIFCKGKVIIGTKGLIEGSLSCASAEIIGSFKGKIIYNRVFSGKGVGVRTVQPADNG